VVDGCQHFGKTSSLHLQVEEMSRVWKTVYNIGKEGLGLGLWADQWESVALKITPFSLHKKKYGRKKG
jgi:hypothetical protein